MADLGESLLATPNGDHHVRIFGSGSPMLVFPGGPGWGARYMVKPLVGLIGEGRQLIFVDQRGTGESPVGTGPLTLDAYLEDMDAVADRLNLDTFDLFGHSFGGLQALKYTIEDSGRVHRLIIADGDPPTRPLWEAAFIPGSRFDARTRPEDQAEIADLTADDAWMSDQKLLDRYLILEYRPLWAEPHTAEHIDHGMDWTRYVQFQATRKAVRDALGDWDITHELHKVDCPTLLVYCRESIFDRRVPHLMMNHLPNSTLAWVGGGHAPFIEDPESFRTAFESFMQRT